VGDKNAVSSCPGAQQVAGFTRSIRNERNDMKLFYLNIEDAAPQDIRTAMRHVYNIMADPASPVVDPEFQLDDMGVLNIWREIPYPFLDRFISRDTGRKIIQSQPLFQQDRPLTLRLGGNKKLDGDYFDDSEVFSEALPPFDVDIAVEAVGLNFKDVLLALGQVREGSPGAECSGIITQIGQGVTGLKIGDRVCGMAKDCFSTHVRAHATSFVRIPDTLSFVEAASLPISFCTAYYALIDVGRLSSSDTLIVHAAAGGLGQAAIMIAKRIGAWVFCTVSNRGKRGLLVSEFGVAESDIFYSRSTSFRDSVLAATGGRGVDVVLNSLAGGQLKATWECIAPFGRFLEVGKRDILANSTLRMKQFERNVSFSAIDLTPFPEDRPHHLQKMLKEIVSMITETGPVGPVRPIQTYPYSEIAQALRAIGGGKTSGKLVVVPGKSEMVLVSCIPHAFCVATS
jgi:NADPH:quinone reductase-like Zn-dependent oxidoreductase